MKKNETILAVVVIVVVATLSFLLGWAVASDKSDDYAGPTSPPPIQKTITPYEIGNFQPPPGLDPIKESKGPTDPPPGGGY